MDSRFRGNDKGEGYFRPVEDETQHDCDIRLPYHEWFLMPVWCFFNRFSPRFYSIPMEACPIPDRGSGSSRFSAVGGNLLLSVWEQNNESLETPR